MAKILHLVLNDYENDNRVRRAAECAHEMGAEVFIYALSKFDTSKKYTQAGVNVYLFYLITRSWSKKRLFQVFKYLEVLIRMIVKGIRYKPNIVHAHDLNTLPIGFFIARLTGAKLIYDSHEYWADAGVLGFSDSPITKLILLLEGYYIRRVDACITVSDSIAELLKKDYNISKPYLVRNVPEKWDLSSPKQLRSRLGINKDKVIVLYQGVINGEGVFDLINAFQQINTDAILVFLGNGTAVNELKGMGVKNVFFHPSVPYEQLPSYTSDADIGIHSMHGNMLNRLNALPNKLFEYIQGELALIVSDLPEMSRIVSGHNLGLVYPNSNTDELANSMKKLINDRRLRDAARKKSADCALMFNWDEEKNILKNIYLRLSK